MKISTTNAIGSVRLLSNPPDTLCKLSNLVPLVALLLIISFSSVANAQQSLLTYYNFNEQTTSAATAATLQSDAPGLQATTISSNFNTPASNVVVFGGSTINKAASDVTTGGTGALSFVAGTSNVNNGNYFQFTFNTLALTDVMLSYATQRTSTGFTTQTLSYSTNGTSFTDFGANTVIPGSFAAPATLFDLSAIDSIENQSNVTFRLTLTGATGASGNNRFDNIQVTAVPEPGTILGGFALLGAVGFRERRRLVGLFGFRHA